MGALYVVSHGKDKPTKWLVHFSRRYMSEAQICQTLMWIANRLEGFIYSNKIKTQAYQQ
jgi:hypothetical protein